MNREVLFRVYNTHTKIYQTLQETALKGDIMPYDNELKVTTNYPLILEQFTGLTDKNGNKVFEGDKIRLSSEYSICGSIPREGIVMWLNDKSMYVIVQEEDINDAWHRHTELHKLPIDSYEVIGNIHDKEVAK